MAHGEARNILWRNEYLRWNVVYGEQTERSIIREKARLPVRYAIYFKMDTTHVCLQSPQGRLPQCYSRWYGN